MCNCSKDTIVSHLSLKGGGTFRVSKLITKLSTLKLIIRHTKPVHRALALYVFHKLGYKISTSISIRSEYTLQICADWSRLRILLRTLKNGPIVADPYNRESYVAVKVWGGYIIAGPIETFSIVQVIEGVYDGFDYNDSVVLDIGGFIGDTALFFIAKGAKKVIVYEPVPENADEIIRNAAINGLSGRVIVKPFAVTDTDGYIEVIKSKDYGTVGFSVLAQYTGETVKLPSRS